MPVTMGHFDLGVFFLSTFPINVQGNLFVLDNHVSGIFHSLKGQNLTLERQNQTDRKQQNKIFLFFVSSLKKMKYTSSQVLSSVFLSSYYSHPVPIESNKMNSNWRQANQNKRHCSLKDKPMNLTNVNYLNHIFLYMAHSSE